MNYSIDVTHPLNIHYDEELYIPIEELPKEIRFSTTASGWEIFTKTNFINSSPINLELDDFKKRRYITGSRLKSFVTKQMDGIQINEILDDTIYVRFDKLKKQKVRVILDAKSLKLKEGFVLASDITITPAEITLTGPQSKMKHIGSEFKLTLDETDLSGNIDEDIRLQPLLKENVKANVTRVNVQAEALSLDKGTKVLKVERINFPKKKTIKLSDQEVKLIYFASESAMDDLEGVKFVAIVDFARLNEKSKTIRVGLKNVPEKVKKYYFEPSELKISYVE